MNAVRLVVGGMVAMGAIFGFGRFAYTPILPHMIEAGLGVRAAGIIAAASYLGYFVSALVGATGIMQTRARLWFVASLALNGVTMIAMAFTDDLALATVLRFISGAGGGVIIIAGATLVFQPLALGARPWMSMLPFCGVGFGIAASSLIVTLLAGIGADWRMMWIVNGLVATAAALVVALLVPDAPVIARTGDAARDDRLIWSRRLALLTLGYGLFGFGYVITATFIVVITRETASLRPIEPWVWIIVGLAGAASIPVWSELSRRIGDVAAFALAMLTEAAGVALSVLVPSPFAIVMAAIMLGGTIMAITAIGLQIGRRLAGGGLQRIQALMTAAFGMGQVVGPVVAGHLRETTGSFLAASLAAALALAVGAALALVP